MPYIPQKQLQTLEDTLQLQKDQLIQYRIQVQDFITEKKQKNRSRRKDEIHYHPDSVLQMLNELQKIISWKKS